MTRILLAAAAAFAAAVPAAEARQCGPRDAVLATLADRFGETRRGYGTAGPQALVELHASAETGTFTVTVTRPDGLTCLIAAGEGWEPVAPELPARGNPT